MLYTIGHSNIDAADFLAAVDAAGVRTVLDVRSHPTSKHEQFRRENMERWLAGRYEWWPELGGWAARHIRGRAALLPLGVDLAAYAGGAFPKGRIGARREGQAGWGSQGLHDYQFFMATDEFNAGLDRLLARAAEGDVAIMCAECLWWKCHRSMVADAVCWRGGDAAHVLYRFRKVLRPRCVATTSRHSEFYDRRRPSYHPSVVGAWERWRGPAPAVTRQP